MKKPKNSSVLKDAKKPEEYVHCIPLTMLEINYLERYAAASADVPHVTSDEGHTLRLLASKLRTATCEAIVLTTTDPATGRVNKQYNSMHLIREAVRYIFFKDPGFKRTFVDNVACVLMDRLKIKDKKKRDDVARQILKVIFE